MTRRPIDPEEERWDRKYPRFPGVPKCVELLRSGNVHGTWIDIICVELEKHAHEYADELLNAARMELDRGSIVGDILLNVVADSKLPQAIGLFAEMLESPDDLMRQRGIYGLKQLDTKEARRLMWRHEQKGHGT